MRRSALLASLVVGWAWVPPSHHHRTPHAVRKPLKAENDYLAALAKAPPKRGPGRLRRAWRRLRGAPAALSSDEVLRLVVLGQDPLDTLESMVRDFFSDVPVSRGELVVGTKDIYLCTIFS